jgi:ATP phosphoribosyltransferase
MIRIAVAKGYLFKETVKIFNQLGIEVDLTDADRKLFLFDKSKKFQFLLVRPSDVPVYVEHGAAELGVVGKDILHEQSAPVVELLDLKFGFCRLAVAGLKNAKLKNNIRVATKFVNSAKEFFIQKGLKAEIIKLYGSVELGPIVGLSDVIVDLVATGKTLKENGLEVMETILESTARLIANPVLLQAKYNELMPLVTKIKNKL